MLSCNVHALGAPHPYDAIVVCQSLAYVEHAFSEPRLVLPVLIVGMILPPHSECHDGSDYSAHDRRCDSGQQSIVITSGSITNNFNQHRLASRHRTGEDAEQLCEPHRLDSRTLFGGMGLLHQILDGFLVHAEHDRRGDLVQAEQGPVHRVAGIGVASHPQ